MAGKLSAAEAMSRKMFRQEALRKKKGVIIAVAAVLVVVGIVLVITKIRRDDKILLAQNLISQFEINTTYRTPELDPSEDNDGDGVINSEETRAGTNPLDMDSDNDGLSDKYEIWIGTNPNNPDTDGDTLLDGYEMIMNLDPRKDKTNGNDSDDTVKIDYKKLEGQLELNVTGNANIADVSIIEMNLFGISSNSGVVSRAYDIASSYKFDSATITFRLDFTKLQRDAVNIDGLSVLRFDKETQKYEKFKTKINKFAGSLSANITQYGTYVIGTEKTANAKPLTRIAFLLDNSGSMYPYEVSKYPAENDVLFQRLDFTKALIEKIDGEGDYQYSIAKFTGRYTLLQGFTKDTDKLKEALRKIRNNDEIFDGSHIETALERCMTSFEDSGGSTNTRNIIVLLSDGASDEKNAKTIDQLAEIADKHNIRIMTVGLGREADRRWLQHISSDTGGKYYSASDADALENVHKQIVTTLNYDIIDYSDEGEKAMGYSLYNTGFDPKKNGFSFKNFRTSDTPSLDFGLALMARDWYVGRIGMNHSGIDPRDRSGQKYSAPGYDFSDTNVEELFEDHRPLSELHPTMLNSQFADVKQYLDYGSFGSTLKVKSSLRKSAEQQGWKIGSYHLDAKNLAWSKVELLSLDLVGAPDKINVTGKNDEYQLFTALYMMNAVQWDDKEAEFDLYKGDDGFAKLKKLLAVGEPVLTMIDGSHTVNAIGLIQDSSDHRKFILTVYDSNYPGAQKKIYITRSVITDLEKGLRSFVVSRLYYKYTCVYEGKQVGISFSDVAI